jgi:conjugative transfer signal peptidase TraF
VSAIAGGARAARPLVLAMGALAIGLLVLRQHVPLVIYNASASAPIGFYRVLPAMPLAIYDLVLARTPDTARELADRRRYIPATVPLVKRVAARPGARVCATGAAVTIDGLFVAERRSTDGQGRTLPSWTGCHVLAEDEFFLLMADKPDSFDSRYFGPVRLDAVIGRLAPLWLR